MHKPDWLDRRTYPFASHDLELEAGRLHYVDEGQGRPLVMVHGTPTWSFLFRHLIEGLASDHRVVAPDLLGFGLSDKPPAAAYRPADQARRLRTLIDRLDLRDVVLVVHDFGGPIGLSYAIEQPDNVRGLVLFNTWMWPRDDATTRWTSRLFGTALGRWLYRRFNFSPRVLLPALFGRKEALTLDVHRHYLRPFATPLDREAPWVYARELTGSNDWYATLWARRKRLQEIPALLCWGERDSAFDSDDLARWQALFTSAHTVTFSDAGHFVPEEIGPALVPTMRDFLEALD